MSTPPPPPVPPALGDMVAWRRPTGPRPASGHGFVRSVDERAVTIVPLSGSVSHELRRPHRDVRVLMRSAELLAGLRDLENRRGPW